MRLNNIDGLMMHGIHVLISHNIFEFRLGRQAFIDKETAKDERCIQSEPSLKHTSASECFPLTRWKRKTSRRGGEISLG